MTFLKITATALHLPLVYFITLRHNFDEMCA